MQKCTLALGCFWKPEENFKSKPGILKTEVGYAGGSSAKTTYEEVCTGNTGHAEVVRLTFDENKISFKKILDLFFKMHDPTQKDMQFPDVGTQYRSEIFYEDEKQKQEMYLFFEKLRMQEQLERNQIERDFRDDMLRDNLQDMYNRMYGERLQAKAMSPDMNMIMRAQNDQSGINSVVNDSPIAQLRMMDYNGKV